MTVEAIVPERHMKVVQPWRSRTATTINSAGSLRLSDSQQLEELRHARIALGGAQGANSAAVA